MRVDARPHVDQPRRWEGTILAREIASFRIILGRRQRAGRAHGDHVAGAQAIALREIGNSLGNADQQVIQTGTLANHAVQACLEAVPGRIAELVGCYHPRAIAARCLEILAQTELAVVHLVFADRPFVDDRITGYMLERAFDRNMPAGLADHDPQFALVVKGFRDVFRRGEDRLATSDIGGSRAQEEMRIVERRGETRFGDMRLEVECERPESIGATEKRKERDVLQRAARTGCREQSGQPIKRAVETKQCFDVGRQIGRQRRDRMEAEPSADTPSARPVLSW